MLAGPGTEVPEALEAALSTLADPAAVSPDGGTPPPVESGPADPDGRPPPDADTARAEAFCRPAPDPAAPVAARPWVPPAPEPVGPEPVDPDPAAEVPDTAPVEPDGPPFPVVAVLADVGLADTAPLVPPAAEALEVELPVAPEDELPVAPAVAPPLEPPLELPVAGPVGPLAVAL